MAILPHEGKISIINIMAGDDLATQVAGALSVIALNGFIDYIVLEIPLCWKKFTWNNKQEEDSMHKLHPWCIPIDFITLIKQFGNIITLIYAEFSGDRYWLS